MRRNIKDDREKNSHQEIVGIWHTGKILCRECAGTECIQASISEDRIRRKDVEAAIHICDICGKPLI